jgi:hypothetical protein
MNQTGNAIKLLVVSLLLLFTNTAKAQFVSKVLDYLPAAGQHTNSEYIGTPAAANSIVGNNNGMVSLGAFGGSVTVYFENGIKNDPANPYGVDFTIYGNSTPTWSEPGIIQVMKDENRNGIPDETWYDITGSDHYWNSTQLNYEITYLNSGLNTASDIQWTDNQGISGLIPENSFHQQSYYPKADLFPNVSRDQCTLKGTRIAGQIDLSNSTVVISYQRAFGYADNTPVLSKSEKLPDNPYTSEIEGSGGDAIDISWAVGPDQKPVNLDEIHFIRIYTGMNALVGWLGEISTEITGIRDVEPANVSGIQSLVVIQDLLPKIRVGEIINLNALVFENGLKQNTGIQWSISNPELAEVSNDQLLAKENGLIKLRATSAANPAIYSEKQLEIYSVGKAVITLPSTSLKVNDKLELSGKLTDQNGNALTGISSSWRVDNALIAEISSLDGKYYLTGKQTGKCWLFLEATEDQSIRDSVQIEVIPESVQKKVYISIKTSEKTIFPRQSVWVDQFDLNQKVDRAQKSYGLHDIRFVSLAHAIAAALKNTESDGEWAFRDDSEGGTALYLWKVPEIDEGSIAYHLGYGGSRTSISNRKTWLVMLNQLPILSGFDQIKVNNDDEILVYHVIDNALPWTVTQLTAGNDSVKTNQSIEIQLRKFSCSMDDNRIISVNSSEVLANQAILANQVSLWSDEFGKSLFSTVNAGNYLLSSGIDVANLNVELQTGIKTNPINPLICKVFPNPFTESIQINSALPIQSIVIHNLEGKQVYRQSNPSDLITLIPLSPGVYIFTISAGNQAFQQKIIKK